MREEHTDEYFRCLQLLIKGKITMVAETMGYNQKKPRVKATCGTCGKTFTIGAHEAKCRIAKSVSKKLFCNDNCFREWMKNGRK